MTFKRIRHRTIIAVAACLLPLAAGATNGYFAHGYSAQQKGLAGAGTAWGSDAFVGSINPALLADVGHRLDASLSLFVPIRDYRVENNPTLEPLTGAGLVQVNALNRQGKPVGFGTRLGSGCTSGHGVCGLARLSTRSLVATLTFMTFGVATVFILRHLLEGVA